jgi:hypothetical protein
MHRHRLLLIPVVVLALLLGAASARGGGSTGVAVAELYASGGNSGATYANDYVELFNAGSSSVDLSGWTLQYASAAGTAWQVTPLAGSVPAGGRYLVQLASSGAVGTALPAPDATGTTNLAVSGGKVAVVRDATALTCGASAGSCAGTPSVEDFVGYGGAADYEGSAPAAAPSASAALARAAGGCGDSGDNSADFALAAPAPENASAAPAPCSTASPGVGADVGVDVDVQPVLSIAVDRTSLSFGAVVPGTTPASLPETVTVTSNGANGYSLSVHRSAFAPADLPLGIALGSGALAPIPVPPASDLLLGSTTGPSAVGGDAWAAGVGFTASLPAVPSGHYTATLTFTAIGL